MQMYGSFMAAMEAAQSAIPASGRVRAGWLSGLPSLVSDLGGDTRAILEQLNIDPTIFDDPDHSIESMAVVNLLEHCSQLFSDPLFGLHLAERQGPEVFGCVMALAQAAPDLRRALECLVEYISVSASPEGAMQMFMGREVVELTWSTHIELEDQQQCYYQGLMIVMKALQMLGRQHFRPRYVRLTFPVSRPILQLLEERLGCKIYGKSEANSIAFPIEVLDCRLTTSNKTLFTLLKNGLDELRTVAKADVVEQVANWVRRALASGNCSVESCADELGTSARTLQKRLTRMGVKFSDIVKEERIKQAKQALLWSAFSLDEIAFRLGYSEQTSFGRAFKQATGMTPKAYRLANIAKLQTPQEQDLWNGSKRQLNPRRLNSPAVMNGTSS